MNKRATSTTVLAIVLMVLVMAVAATVTFTGSANRTKWVFAESWKQPAASVQSIKLTNLTAEAKTNLFVQAGDTIQVYDAAGELNFSLPLGSPLATTLGDVDSDGRTEIIAFYRSSEGSTVAALRGDRGATIWQRALKGLGEPARVAAIDFDGTGRPWVVVGDNSGQMVALSSAGEERWRYTLKDTTELRGLDDILAEGKTHLVAVAARGGNVAALNQSGKVAWSYSLSGGLRRLRTEQLALGRSTVLLGGENGELVALTGSSGTLLWQGNVGQAVTEIRPAELDGNSASREVVVGGKNGGVWGLSSEGKTLFSTGVGGSKVMEIGALAQSGTNRDLLAVGDEGGAVTFFDAAGRRLGDEKYSAPINRLGTAKLQGQEQFLVADAASIRALAPQARTAPFWYTPLLGGLLACAVIAVAAWIVGSLKPAPALQLSAEQMTVEAQKARRLMLHETIADLERMRQAGEVPADAYLARLKDLRAQLADAEANLIKLGVPLQAETIKCPHCGGTLQLGTDRCDYCGQTVIV